MSASEPRRRERILVTAAIASSLLASALVLYAVAGRLASFEGYAVSGYVGLLGYQLEVLGSSVRAPPLESVKAISVVDALIALAGLALALAGALALARGRLSLAGELSSAACIASALSLALTQSLVRVVAEDVIPALPVRGVFATPAGRLALEAPVVNESLALTVFHDARALVLLWATLGLALAVASAYVAWRRLERERALPAAGSP
ncbi:MAG: hypothetical protein QXS85_04355 [Acidilobaceae archaeon]